MLHQNSKSDQGVAYLEFAIAAPIFFWLIFFIFELLFFLNAQIAVNMAATQVVNFGFANYHKKNNPATTLDLDGLREFVSQEVNRYSLKNINPSDLAVDIYTSGVYGDLDGPDSSPAEPFINDSGSASRQNGDYWIDVDSSAGWDRDIATGYGIFSGDAPISSVEITLHWPWTLLPALEDGIIKTKVPVINVFEY